MTDFSAHNNPTRRVRVLHHALRRVQAGIAPVVDLSRPYVSGLVNLPADGRFLLVGNHTTSGSEVMLVPHFVRRAIGTWVRPLADRRFGERPGFGQDLMTAYGGVVGAPESARDLMRDNETILVFPGGAREISKFKGEEYQLNWSGRSGFARIAVENGYPIVPVGLVGGDDVYKILVTRDSAFGRLSRTLSERMSGRTDLALPLMRGIGPTFIPRPQRMYLHFGEPIDTTTSGGATPADRVAQVRDSTQQSLEKILTELLSLRADDPYRELNPLAWAGAVRAA